MAAFTYTNSTGMTIADNAISSQSLNVYGTLGTITDVSVNITGLFHNYAADLDMLLVAPNGTDNLEFLSDAAGGADFNGDYTFADGGTIIDESSAPYSGLAVFQ